MESGYESESNENSAQKKDLPPAPTGETEYQKLAKMHAYKMLFSDWRVILTLIPSLFVGATSGAFYLVFAPFINSLAKMYTNPNYDIMNDAKWFSIYMAIIAVVAAICKLIDTICWIQAGSIVSLKLRKLLFESIVRSDVSFIDSSSIGEMITLMSEDAKSIQTAFGTDKGKQIQNLSTFLCGLIFTFIYSWKVGLIFLGLCIIIPFLSMPFVPGIKKHSINKFIHTSAMMTYIEETISSIRVYRSFNQEDHRYNLFKGESNNTRKCDRYVSTHITLSSLVLMVFLWGTLLGCFYLVAWLISKGKDDLAVGDILAVYGFWMMSTQSIMTLMYSSAGEAKALAAAARIYTIVNRQPSVPFEGGEIIKDLKGHIKFENVSFKYPTRDAYVLKNVSFEVLPNQMTALVGHSGSGKSTCAQLIERFYDVTEGRISIDGKDIRDLDPRWLHQNISCVQQEPVLFKDTIRNNVIYGNLKASKKEINHAIEVANAQKFINKFPKGLKELVGEKGVQLSGGQKQRIAIARAVIKNPKILITDEATSSLDAANEKKVQLALDEVMKNRTSVCIAHRLSTIKNAKIIYVFESGEIKESGSHEQLISQKGIYFNLIQKQMENQVENPENETDAKNEDSKKIIVDKKEKLKKEKDSSNHSSSEESNSSSSSSSNSSPHDESH
ncbi:ABC transporter family protein [Tritrichomonas foetus]|uniref:ABC transporter family protein n=1 Tax=Tritrichomonas foetus TaxID=1144522 RepID=A0A1J4KQ85_9EUKA|nr:ABC transporter family protein [Tritrichomonas foetus]|eukprot:OHT13465.1 ABC transporter family protein [Tritrichomonas foetus]